jgi:tight adherence protein C
MSDLAVSAWVLQAVSAGAAVVALAVARLAWVAWPPFVGLLAGARAVHRPGLSRQPRALRWLLALAACFEPLARRLPVQWQQRASTWLERAGLLGQAGATAWLALPAAVFVVGLALMLALAPWTGAGAGTSILVAAVVSAAWPASRLRRCIVERHEQVQRDLPAYLEMVTLGLEAGSAFPAALLLAMSRAPEGALREEFARLLQELRAGQSRRDALIRLDQRVGVASLSATVAALIQAEATGVSLAPVLRAQARRGVQERFARAEKRALEAPVRMLGPLILCIFPCTFIVVGFPIAAMLFWGA